MSTQLLAADDAQDAPKRDTANWVLLAVCLGGFLFQADLTALSAIVLDVSRDLRNGSADPAWLMDVYSLALIFALPAAGSLADRFGRRRLFVAGIGLFAAASVFCALAPEFFSLLFFRACQGVSGALLTSAGAALLAQSYMDADRRAAFSTLGIVIGASMVIGPPLGSALSQTVGWRWLFWLNIPTAIVILWCIRRAEDKSPKQTHPIDWPGCGLFALGTALLCFTLLEMKHLSEHPSWLAALVIATVAAFAAFIQVEQHRSSPALDLSLLRSRQFLGICMVPVASSIAYWSLLVYVPQFARGPLGMGAAETGWLLTCLTLPMLILPRFGAKLAGKMRAGIFFGSSLAIIGCADLVLALTAAVYPTKLLTGGCLLLAGVGAAIVNAQISAAAVAVVPIERAAMASAISTVMRQFGFAFGIAVLGLCAEFGGYPSSFFLAGGFGLAAAVACGFLLNPSRGR